MTLFDAYLAVDWSAKSSPTPKKPSRDAVWIGERPTGDKPSDPGSCATYFRTRRDCLDYLRERLTVHKAAGRRVFLGFDFAYGYPTGFAEVSRLHGTRPPWQLVWNELQRLIVDNEDNSNNRFKVAGELNSRCQGATLGPYWGCPANWQIQGLSSKSPLYPFKNEAGLVLQAKRETERRLGGVQPTWKLFGNGAVGGQTLLGIPAVAKLRDDLEFQHISRVWPFETGFRMEPVAPGTPFILHVEIWPGIVNNRIDHSLPIRDQAQVCTMVDWIAELDEANELLQLFGRPAGISEDSLKRVVDEEGWIFGPSLVNE
jgi:hypothetical protein